VGLNYRDHAAESEQQLPEEPLLFGKFANTLVGPGVPILLPPGVGHVDAEAELALVVGRRASKVSRSEALDYLAGYTAANDVSARDIQFRDGQWFRGKGLDTFCPILPVVVPVSVLGDAGDLRVVQRLNGTVLQDDRTSALIFDVPTLLAHVSQYMTLDPGDLILTGTPQGVGYFREPRIALSPGDVVEVEVEGVGILTNPVLASGDDR
jgi:2-keto-4-pentenoate hydratase/2-oxohepta-3-ene-1,7-dioic acid hydratase in catechol pathway